MFKITKIFIIDDDTDVVLLFEQFLVIEGHEVVAKAYNGEEAINIFKEIANKPNLILMDHRMPVKNGLETTEEILSISPDIKIIFVSADYTIKKKALEIGAIDFLEKPIDLNTLITMVEKYSVIENEAT
ncbi:MAG: response regulator [Candidatus Lokiarchaeota archaeon]|nr:response regulator [Candidatus Lokiarchaeota archaeon]